MDITKQEAKKGTFEGLVELEKLMNKQTAISIKMAVNIYKIL